jgi:tetratricopeptide (TPR) repeat protein
MGQAAAVSRAEALARTQLDSGQFRASRDAFAGMLALSRTRRDSATSLFGKAYAEQQIVVTDSANPVVVRRLIEEYRLAQRLDPARYQAGAEFNIALLLASTGQHDSSANAYRRVAQADPRLRGVALLAAARQLRHAGQSAAAMSAARQAAADSSVAAEAQTLLVELYRDARLLAALVALADTLQSPSAPFAAVNEALADMMQDPRWRGAPWVEQCLIVLARNLALLDVGPVHFAATQRHSLERAAAVAGENDVAGAIRNLLDAYRVRDSTETYTMSSEVSWWMKGSPGDRRRATWSRTLRSLGDWYNRAGFNKVAISFYESALGAPRFPVHEDWVDPDALPPLPALYATLPDTGREWDRIYRLEDLTKALFEGKGAIRPGNEQRLRTVRLTLGHLFAQQGRWDNAWYGAIYQLEESRRLGRRMLAQNPTVPVHYPPEVYELLFAEYVKRGCSAEALSVAEDLRAEYTRRRAAADAERIANEVRRLRQSPPGPRAASCPGVAVGTN